MNAQLTLFPYDGKQMETALFMELWKRRLKQANVATPQETNYPIPNSNDAADLKKLTRIS